MASIVLDSSPVGSLCNPNSDKGQKFSQRLGGLLAVYADPTIYIPEVVDYEVRRSMERIRLKSGADAGIRILDRWIREFAFIPLDRKTMLRAALLWAQVRMTGQQTACEKALDADAIICASILENLGSDAIVVTGNPKHMSLHFANVIEWDSTVPP